jgi:esterase/lipase
MITKEYFLDRLNAGDDIDTIGQEIANMMNEALEEKRAAEEIARQQAADNEAAKRDIIEEMIELVQEYAILEGMEPDEIVIKSEDIDQMIAAFTEMFDLMRSLKKLQKAIPAATTNSKSDDQILAEFAKLFS